MAGEYLTMAEIQKKYPQEWVLIDRPKTAPNQHVLAGHVLFHSPDKLAVYDKVKELPRPFDIAVWYIGPFPEDVAFLL